MDLAVLVRNLADHYMDDVAVEVLVAARDEDLGAVHLVGAVGLFHGFGLHQAKVGAAARLGEGHGSGPFAGTQFGARYAASSIRGRPPAARHRRPPSAWDTWRGFDWRSCP